jgi:integrase
MPNVNFYTKKPRKGSREALIYLQMKYAGYKLVHSFDKFVDRELWDNKKQRVKKGKDKRGYDRFYLNDLLNDLERECGRIYDTLAAKGVPAPEAIKRALIAYRNGGTGPKDKPNLFGLIKRFLDNEIGAKKNNTIRSYKTTFNHLLQFAHETKTVVDFEAINLDFYYKLFSYLKKRGLSDNSIGKEIKNLKTFMTEAVDMQLTDNIQFKHKKFKVTREDTEAVYLTWKEIVKLHKFDLAANQRLESVRDLFVFGCCTGLRYSDYSKVKPENIVKEDGEYWIAIKTQKTGAKVHIPCHPLVLEIFNRYKANDNKLPKAISNQKFNDYVKECCKLAGLTHAGRLTSKAELELWQCVTSHTARRSFATNYYLEGFPVIELMKITGHSSEKSFMRYIKVSQLDAGKKLQQHVKKNWGNMLLKVAS